MNYKNTYVYIHGLHSSKESKKYIALQHKLDVDDQLLCIEWQTTGIDKTLQYAVDTIIKDSKAQIILIGDSTGGNFACQIREMLKHKGIYAGLVLINPLLLRFQLYDSSIMPESTLEYVRNITDVSDSLIFLSDNDTVVNHHMLPNYILDCNNIRQIKDTHSFLRFAEYIDYIKYYANSIL